MADENGETTVVSRKGDDGNFHATASRAAGGQLIDSHAVHPNEETARSKAKQGIENQINAAKAGDAGKVPTH